MTGNSRIDIRTGANKPECNPCRLAKDLRYLLAGRVDTKSLSLREAIEHYNAFVIECSGLEYISVPYIETPEGEVNMRVAVDIANENGPYSEIAQTHVNWLPRQFVRLQSCHGGSSS